MAIISTVYKALDEPGIRRSAYALLVLVTGIYLFLPSILITPMEGALDTRLVWGIYEGTVAKMPARRAFLTNAIEFVTLRTGMPPWKVWIEFTFFAALASVFLTYLFVNHFRRTGPLAFLVGTLAVPYWALKVQFPSDNGAAFLFYVASILLAAKGRGWLPLAAAAAVVGIMVRADCFPVLGVAGLVIWMDRDSWNKRIVDSVIFVGLSLIILEICLRAQGITTFYYIEHTLMQAGSIDMVISYGRADYLLKIFTINSVILAPFYVWYVVSEARSKGIIGLIQTTWPLVPIIVYIYAYWNAMVSPRYQIYSAPFLVLIVLNTWTFATEKLKKLRVFAWKPVIPAIVAFVLFNPIFHILYSNADANSNNIVERFTHNYANKTMVPNVHTGLGPILSFIYRVNYQTCIDRLKSFYDGFLKSDKKNMIMYTFGADGYNHGHLFAIEAMYDHFGIDHRLKINTTDKGLRQTFHRFDDVFSDIWRLYKSGKSLIYVGAFSPGDEFESDLFRRFKRLEPDIKFSPDQTYGSFRFNFNWGYYPSYLRSAGLCDVRVRTPVDVPGPYPAAATAQAGTKILYPNLPKAADGQAPAKAVANPPAAGDREAFLLRQRGIENDLWLMSIPDYEMRLYDRIKRLNARTVDIVRLLVIGFVIALIALPVAVAIAARKAVHANIEAKGDSKPVGPLGKWTTWLGGIEVSIRLAIIVRRQKRLMDLCARIERAIADGKHGPDATGLVETLRAEIGRIAEESERFKAGSALSESTPPSQLR